MTAYHDSSFIDPDVSAAAERAGCHLHPNARGPVDPPGRHRPADRHLHHRRYRQATSDTFAPTHVNP